MKQSDGIAYEKPELLEYTLWGIANGAGGDSQPGDQEIGDLCADDFIEA